MKTKTTKDKDVTCREIALRACRELLVAAEARPTQPNVSRALVLARYAIAMRP
jgi:hypothetical protein